MKRRLALPAAVAAAALVAAAPAYGHGLVGRSDLPIPEVMFAWAAAGVLVVSFVALGTLWRSPRLEEAPARRVARIPRMLVIPCGTVGLLAFAGVVYAGLAGSQTPTANALPTAVYVLLWVGVPIVSAVVGDVFRAFSPWRAIGRASGWALQRVMAEPPPPLPYPEWLGRWPAVLGLVTFGWLELVAGDGDKPATLAVLALGYLAVQLVGMSLYGVQTWTDRGDTFGVYFSMFARISPLAVADGSLVVRRPLSGLTSIRWLPGTVTLLCAAIGITAFDGAAEGPTWGSISNPIQRGVADLGFSLRTGFELAFTIGLLLSITIVGAFYRTGTTGVHREVPERSHRELATRFGHSLAPIALAYILAHYFSLLAYQGQATFYLISDPLGNGSDFFGTALVGIDYGVLSATAIWYVQVLALVCGHVAALIVAHDRALFDFGPTQKAVRSQYWMLGVMVAFTTLGLWLLSEANG